MDKEYVDSMIATAEANRKSCIKKANAVITDVIDTYKRITSGTGTCLTDHIPAMDATIELIRTEEEADSMRLIQSLHEKDEWDKDHDAVWPMFLEIRSCQTWKYAKKMHPDDEIYSDAGLSYLELKIDPLKTGNIRSTYTDMYLDTDWISYDGDIIISDPFYFIGINDFPDCPSLKFKDMHDNNTVLYTVNDSASQKILGSMTTETNKIGVVLAKELWQIESANTALRTRNTQDYAFLKQFHGEIRFTVTEDKGNFYTDIESRGNICFHITKIKTGE